MQNSSFDIATAFAKALDQDDFTTAQELLAENCVYHSPDGLFKGPDAIIASYRQHADYAIKTFDKVVYDSHIEDQAEGILAITYIDHLYLQNQQHTYSCRQIVKVGAQGKIEDIAHQEIAGELEKIREFYKKVGLAK